MTGMLNIGVDLGGTTTKMAFINDDGKVLNKWAVKTDTSVNGKNIVRDIAGSIAEKMAEHHFQRAEIRGIGIGAPGFIDMPTGFISQAVNIGWKNYQLREDLERQTGFPAIVDNDANTAALGEMWLGAGKGAANLICVTLGTGVGSGIIINGDIVHGASGMAGEIGHMTVITKGGATCNCGKTGCLETVASATGIRRLALEALDYNDSESILRAVFEENGDIGAEDVFGCAKKGDSLSAAVVDKAAGYLGYALAAAAMVNNPEKIVLGGGVSQAGELLLRPVIYYFERYALPKVSEAARIVIAELGNDAGMIGGAWLAKTKITSVRQA